MLIYSYIEEPTQPHIIVMKRLLALLCTFSAFQLCGQTQLLPCINTGTLPADQDSIQPFVNYIDTSDQFMIGGFQLGDPVADFMLYDTGNVAVQLSQLLSDGKPALIVSASASCPAYRNTAQYVLPDMYVMFGSSVHFVVVYQLEAHPVGPDFSPFSDTVNTTAINIADSILLPQHRTYGDRKNAAIQLFNTQVFSCPTVIDGPGNEFWNTYGPSPNNGYLIAPNGTVYAKYGWMQHSKVQAISDILELLSLSTGVLPASDCASLFTVENNGCAFTQLHNISQSNIDVTVFDEQGQLVLSKSLSSGETISIGIALNESGLYLIQAVTEDRKQVARIIHTD